MRSLLAVEVINVSNPEKSMFRRDTAFGGLWVSRDVCPVVIRHDDINEFLGRVIHQLVGFPGFKDEMIAGFNIDARPSSIDEHSRAVQDA